MYNRLNWRNLTEDFVDRFLNVENNFLKTFIGLFKRPEDVIGGYIDGMRKRYLSAFSYFAISLTIVGLYTFVFRKWFLTDDMFRDSFMISADANLTKESVDDTVENTKQIMNWIFEYQSILTFLNIPFYAIISKFVFWNYRKYNFIEHVVIYLYVYSHTQIIASIVGIFFLWSNPIQMILSFVLMFVYVGYTAYVLKRLFDLTLEKIILKTILFGVIFVVFGGIFFGLGGWLFYKLGAFDGFIESMEQMAEKQKALREAAKTAKDSISVDSVKQLTKKIKDTVLLLGS